MKKIRIYNMTKKDDMYKTIYIYLMYTDIY